jgi:excisionase family DNA binding protein
VELYTVDEAAAILRLNADTIRRLLREGRLPGIKIGAGQQWRVRKDDLDAYISRGVGTPKRMPPQEQRN